MATPTISELEGWSPDVLFGQAVEWDNAAADLAGQLQPVARSVDGSKEYWLGDAGAAMRTRHNEVQGDATTVKTALQDGATAARAGGRAVNDEKIATMNLVRSARAELFDVADDGTVSVSPAQAAATFAANPVVGEAQTAMLILQSIADRSSTEIKAALVAAGVADDEAERMVTAAFANLKTTQLPAPPGGWPGELTGESGKEDGEAVASGAATDEDKREIADNIRDAGLTPAQVADVAAGKQVQLTQNQWDYLHEFANAAGKDGLLSLTEDLTAQGAQTQAASVADQLNNLANPSVTSAGGAQGGLSQLPPDLRDALTKPAIEFDKFVNGNSVYTVPNADELSRVTSMMGLAGEGSARGSEINGELINKSAELAGLDRYGADHLWRAVDVSPQTVDDLATQTLRVGGADAGAVHDVLTGENSKTVLDSLVRHEWHDDGAALGDMFKSVEGDATSPDLHISTQAGETASTLAKYLSDKDANLLNMDGEHSAALGEVNPRALQGMDLR